MNFTEVVWAPLAPLPCAAAVWASAGLSGRLQPPPTAANGVPLGESHPAVPERWPPVTGAALPGTRAPPGSVCPNTPFCRPLPTCHPHPARSGQGSASSRARGRCPGGQDRVSAERRPGPGSTHRPPAAAAAAGAGAAAPWAATGGGAGPGSGAVLGGAVCRCEPQPGGPAIKGGFLPRAGSPRAPVRAVLSIWPEGRSCRWKSRRELGAVTRAAERGAGAGVTPRRSPIGAASPLLPALAAVFSFWITAVPW